MNHVRVALDRHELVNFDGADGCDAAHVVSTQINQHDVFRALLRVGELVRLEFALFFRRGAAPACAGDGPKLYRIAGEPHQGFGRRADDAHILELQVKHVG